MKTSEHTTVRWVINGTIIQPHDEDQWTYHCEVSGQRNDYSPSWWTSENIKLSAGEWSTKRLFSFRWRPANIQLSGESSSERFDKRAFDFTMKIIDNNKEICILILKLDYMSEIFAACILCCDSVYDHLSEVNIMTT